METTNLPIGEISARVGYPSQLHFSRAFKNVWPTSTGMEIGQSA